MEQDPKDPKASNGLAMSKFSLHASSMRGIHDVHAFAHVLQGK